MNRRALISLLAIYSTSFIFASDDGFEQPIMVDKESGWRQKATEQSSVLLHTDDGGAHWTDVTPPALKEAVRKAISEGMSDWPLDPPGLSALTAKSALLAIVPIDSGFVRLEYTNDAGRHWKEKATSLEAEGAPISFVDVQHGFLLSLGSPAEGLMHKAVYATEDGGDRWYVLTPPPSGSYYPTGISFRSPTEGWITATYHGAPDQPLFHTRDGGKSWQLQQFPIPDDYRGGYADTYAPVFTGPGKKMGYLPVKLERADPEPGHTAYVTYESSDGGATWHYPASGVQSYPDN